MSDARVTFSTLNYDHSPCPVGAEARFSFNCPKEKGGRCGGLLIAGRSGLKRDPKGQNGGVPMWDWDGDLIAPTFSPSIDCTGCWHGYIVKGRCVVSPGGAEEPEP